MKKRISYLLLLTFLVGGITAQNRGQRMTREDAINQKWSYIVENMQLSAEDIATAEPIFRETEQKIWELLQSNWEANRQFRQSSNHNEQSYEALNEHLINYELKTAALQKQYYQQLKEAGLSAKTIHGLLNADKDFKRNLMRQGSGAGQPQRSGQNEPEQRRRNM